MPSEQDWTALVDLSENAFTEYLSIGEARALHEYLANTTPKHAALFCSTATEALLAISAVQKLSDWLLTRAMNGTQYERAGEPPDDE